MTDLNNSSWEALDGEDRVGSYRHSSIQTNIAHLLKINKYKKIHVVTELSLDISNFDLSKYDLKVKNELEPDISGYFKVPDFPDGQEDLIRVAQMPDLAIEILSPGQSLMYLKRKIGALFAVGVQSCWLVIPPLSATTVFSTSQNFMTFDLIDEEVIDEKLEIHIPTKEIFEL